MAAVTLGLSSCKQEDEPKYHNPTTFTISTPALQNQEFLCSSEMTDEATFNLFCSQPDYGFSAICNYSAICSLDPNCPEETATELENTLPTSAAMAIKTFELGAALNTMLGITDYQDFVDQGIANNAYKVYFRAVCEIPGIEGSRIVSDNVVSYNFVKIQYAEKKPAWIFICGDVQTLDNSIANGFLGPAPGNQAAYDEFWSLYEPKDMIGKKLYVGRFNLTPKNAAPNPDSPDDASQFRFFTKLAGWSPDFSFGSNESDFYCLPITDKWTAGYSGDIVDKGLGNWGIHVATPQPMTVVVDQLNLKIYVKEGNHEVTFVGRQPEFN